MCALRKMRSLALINIDEFNRMEEGKLARLKNLVQMSAPMAEQTPDSIITTQRNGQTIVAELFFNQSSTETFRDKLLKLVLADSSRLSASDGQEPEKTEILR